MELKRLSGAVSKKSKAWLDNFLDFVGRLLHPNIPTIHYTCITLPENSIYNPTRVASIRRASETKSVYVFNILT